MNENTMNDPPGLIQSFHLMWDHFPGVCTLVHKTKRVVASNPAAIQYGRVEGMICSSHGPAESHKGCLAGQALKAHETQTVHKDMGDTNRVIYWLPIDGYDDYYLHFSVAIDKSLA